MKNKKSLLALAALCLAAVVMLGIWRSARPTGNTDLKHITVEVCHKDQTINTFAYETDAEYLGDVLTKEGLISGSESEYGLFVDTVDGETADYTVDGGWWQLTCNGEPAQTGADTVALEDGAVYGWIYTVS